MTPQNQAIKTHVNKKELQAALAIAHLYPNKGLGQHFLVHEAVALRIASLDGFAEGAKVLEIGPGLGALTGYLIAKGACITAVEIDAGLCHFLEKKYGDAIEIHHADFLKIQLPDEFSVCVSNLPYYCASEILFKIAAHYSMPRVYVMVQKEMASRIEALPGSKQYGAMTISLRLYFTVQRLFDIERQAFYPEPDVTSSFLLLERRQNMFTEQFIRTFHVVVKSAFWGRRKPIANALARSPHCAMGKEKAHTLCSEVGVDPASRAEELSFDDYIRLTHAFLEEAR